MVTDKRLSNSRGRWLVVYPLFASKNLRWTRTQAVRTRRAVRRSAVSEGAVRASAAAAAVTSDNDGPNSRLAP